MWMIRLLLLSSLFYCNYTLAQTTKLKQPNIVFYLTDNTPKSFEGIGGQLISNINYDIIKNKNLLGFTVQAGYKSAGYSIAEHLNKGLIIRAGLFFKLF